MHDRFAINEIEPLNLKTRVREIYREGGRERERERDYRFIGSFFFFRMQRLMRAYFLQRFDQHWRSNRSGREEKNLYLVVKW